MPIAIQWLKSDPETFALSQMADLVDRVDRKRGVPAAEGKRERWMEDVQPMKKRRNNNTSHRALSFDDELLAVDSSSTQRSWAAPRGRRTIQDKIAEQLQRAADFERELRTVGVPTAVSPVAKPLAAKKQTVAMSVIKRSPAVRPNTVESPPPTSPEPEFEEHFMLVPSVIFRNVGDQMFIQQPIGNFFRDEEAYDLSVSSKSLADSDKPLREERLSTKLKRIKAKAGDVSEESPRGFLSQKIETLKRRESHLQQEYEDALNFPITLNGICSARFLQHQHSSAAMRPPTGGRLMFHSVRSARNNPLE